MGTVVVADAGQLIGLARINHLALLQSLYGYMVVPESGRAELRVDSDRPGGEPCRPRSRKTPSRPRR
jgi:predicted nucleic acid-binding protein